MKFDFESIIDRTGKDSSAANVIPIPGATVKEGFTKIPMWVADMNFATAPTIPEAMIKTTQRQMMDEFAQRVSSQGLSFEQYLQFTGMTEEQMLEQIRPQAELRIKSRLVLEAIVAAEKIEATEEDFEQEIAKMAEMYQMEADKAKELIGEAGKAEIMKDLAVTKAAEFVRDNAKESKSK